MSSSPTGRAFATIGHFGALRALVAFAVVATLVPAAAEAQRPDSGRRTPVAVTRATPQVPAARASQRAVTATSTPRPGQCAFDPRSNRYVGVVESVGEVGRDAAGRPAAGQRRVHVRLPNRLEINVTHPRHLAVRDCPPPR